MKRMDQNSSTTTFDSTAMAASFASLNVSKVTVERIGTLSNDEPLIAPVYDGHKIVLDLTTCEDDWLEILATNATTQPHYENEVAETLHVALKLHEHDAILLDELDKKIMTEKGYSVIKSKLPWYSMNRGKGKVIVNFAMGNTAAPTQLRIFKDGKFTKGTGYAFLQDCLGGDRLQDFVCKAIVEMECIQESSEAINVLITAHSVMLVKIPKRTVVDYSADEEEIAIRAAKRLKYRF